MNPFRKLHNFVKAVIIHRTKPLRIEFVVTDYCNLNCRGCTHYSPLAAKEFEPLDQLERNAAHLGRISDGGKGLEAVYLIGGETLLYPHINEAMALMRRHFPNTGISVFTNGLPLPRMSDEFWASAVENRINIAITRYPIKFDYDAVEQLCRDKGVMFSIFGDRGQKGDFFRFPLDPEKKQNKHISHFKCYNFGCISVLDEKIFPCSISACIGHLNKACGNIFEHVDGDYLEVDKVSSISQIRRLRNRPTPFCSYCKLPPQIVDYAPSKRDTSEWIDYK